MVEIRSSLPALRLSPAPVWQPLVFLALAMLLGVALIRLPLPLAGALVVGTAVLFFILIQPLLGLALTLLVGPLGALENVVLGQTLLNSGQILLLVTLAAWLARGLLQRHVTLPHIFLNVPLALFVYVATLSLLQAPSLEFGLREVVKWLEIGAVMLVVADSASWRVSGDRQYAIRNTQYVLAMLLLAGLSQALVGIWQFGLRGDGPEHFLVLGRFYRAYGTFEQPNPFGGFVNLTALLAAGTLLGLLAACWQSRGVDGKWASLRVGESASDRSPQQPQVALPQVAQPQVAQPLTRSSLIWLLFVLLCTAATTLALLFSWSRGAWLGFAAAVAVLVLFWPKRRWQGLLLLLAAAVFFWAAVGAGVAVGAVPVTVSERLSGFGEDLRLGDVGDTSTALSAGSVAGVDVNDANYAVLERLAHWEAALAMARDHPWLGVGFGNYEPAYSDYALINWPYPLGHAHNYYLNILAEAGVLGLAAYVLFWAAVFWQTLKALRRLDWPQRGIALGLLAAWVGLSVHHLVDKLYVNNMYIHLGAMLGLLHLLYKQAESHIHNVDMHC